MTKRPISVTIVSLVLIAAGVAGLAYHATEFKTVQFDTLGIAAIRLLAIIAGVFMLLGKNWARWVAIVWIAFHVVVSFYHSIGEVAMHAVILLIFAFFLFREPAQRYFRREANPTV